MNRNQVGGKFDELKGRVKKATGELAGDGQLKAEGTLDKAVGGIKKAAGDVKEKIDRATEPHTTEVKVERKP